jgi:hypothetical protein
LQLLARYSRHQAKNCSKLLPEEDIADDEDYNFGDEILDYINQEEELVEDEIVDPSEIMLY